MNESGLSRREAYLVLNALPLMGPITLNRLLEAFDGDPVRVLEASSGQLQRVPSVGQAVARMISGWREQVDLPRERSLLDKAGVRFVVPEDRIYPALLREIHDPPIGLYWLGDYQIDVPCIAIVGSRKCTRYGLEVARKLAGELARMDFCIVSGMARGTDRAAHEGALEAGGRTLAVFGNGIDIVYPPENVDLYREIRENGAVLSEFPFGKKANRTTFPMRNRVVSGICRAVIVVETDVQGGSMITARFAMEQNRTVFAVPGRIDMPSSAGCLQLIKDGAVMLTSVEDVLEELGYTAKLKQMGMFEDDSSMSDALPAEEGEPDPILEVFRGGAILERDHIAEATGLPIQEIASRLMLLELDRKIVKRVDGRYELRNG